MKSKVVLFVLLSCILIVVTVGACGIKTNRNSSTSDNGTETGKDTVVTGGVSVLSPTLLPTEAPVITPTPAPEAMPSPTLSVTTVPVLSPVPTSSPETVVSSTPVATAIPGSGDSEESQSGEDSKLSECGVPQTGTWQLKHTTDKKYIILGTDDDNIGNPKFFRLLRTYNFPYTMNTEAENARGPKELGPDTDDTIFTTEDAPALFPDGVDVVTLGKYLYENDLGEVAQHGSSGKTLWDSEKLAGDFLTSVHTNYVQQGGTKTKEELRIAIMEQLSDTDGSQGASYVEASRAYLEDTFGFPIDTVGIWGGAPVAVIDGIECSLNRIKGTSNFDWREADYTSVGTVLGTQRKNSSTYDLSRITCGVEEVVSYIEKIEPGKVCEFFWHMPFNDEPDITKWRTLFGYIKSLVDSGEAEVVTRRQYAALGEWVENPITKISVDRPIISLGESDSDYAYTITATYADNSTADVSDEAILDRSAVNTKVSGTYIVTASYRGFNSSTKVSVIDTGYTIPEGLKDSEYWFLAKNETQQIMIAGNTTSAFGRADASASTLAFFNCTEGRFNAWVSGDNGATWTQVNKDNRHYKNIKTNTTDGTSGFNFGCVAGDCIIWLETSGNFAINY